MAKFECKICGEKRELSFHTLKMVNGEIVSPEAKCCLTYMKSIRSNKGFGGIIKKPDGKVGGKF